MKSNLEYGRITEVLVISTRTSKSNSCAPACAVLLCTCKNAYADGQAQKLKVKCALSQLHSPDSDSVTEKLAAY